jgi:hypothetical protein
MPKQPTLDVALRPRKQFHGLLETRRAFQSMVSGSILPVAITHALAEYALKSGSTTEKLQGAREFISELLYLGEEDPPKTTWPDKSLKDERDFSAAPKPTTQGKPNAP